MIEGPSRQPWMTSAADAKRLVEACLSARTSDALLHPPNLPPGFFDLSTGIAGECLQKWRNYRIRVAVVCPRGSVSFSTRFGEMAEEETRGKHFGFVESRDAALEWLRKT